MVNLDFFKTKSTGSAKYAGPSLKKREHHDYACTPGYMYFTIITYFSRLQFLLSFYSRYRSHFQPFVQPDLSFHCTLL